MRPPPNQPLFSPDAPPTRHLPPVTFRQPQSPLQLSDYSQQASPQSASKPQSSRDAIQDPQKETLVQTKGLKRPLSPSYTLSKAGDVMTDRSKPVLSDVAGAANARQARTLKRASWEAAPAASGRKLNFSSLRAANEGDPSKQLESRPLRPLDLSGRQLKPFNSARLASAAFYRHPYAPGKLLHLPASEIVTAMKHC